jgi:hypothetical protein
MKVEREASLVPVGREREDERDGRNRSEGEDLAGAKYERSHPSRW